MYIIFNYVYVWVWFAEGSNGLSGAGITDSCELPHMGAANQALEELEILLMA